MKYELPALPYGYTAFEPYIDAKTMEIHYTKHHQGYTDKLNVVLEKYPTLQEQSIEALIRGLAGLAMDEKDKTTLKNNGGGYINHKLFWEIMGPKKEVDHALSKEIAQTFGSIEAFKTAFSEVAKSHFGSGWAWLVRNTEGALIVYSLANQDSPYLKGHTPILGLDVWEHAYYLKYQNRRPEYVENWWHTVKIL